MKDTVVENFVKEFNEAANLIDLKLEPVRIYIFL